MALTEVFHHEHHWLIALDLSAPRLGHLASEPVVLQAICNHNDPSQGVQQPLI